MGYRLTLTRTLIEQIKSDYVEFNRLKEKVQTGRGSSTDVEDLSKFLSWLEKGVRSLGELEGSDIENITWAQIGDIENEIKRFGRHNLLRPANSKDII
jgi:SPX domain protein involved in polyphosphate accumulation